MPDTDPSSLLAAIRDRNESYIEWARLTEWSVKHEPCGDVRTLLRVAEAVLALAGEWENAEYPGNEPMTAFQGHITAAGIEVTMSCGHALREAITRELAGEGNADV